MLSSGPRAGFYVPVRTYVASKLDNNNTNEHENISLATKIVSAMITGTIGSIIANPIDVVKVRLMTNPNAYPSTINGLWNIFNSEGMGGLYKGLLPSTLRAAFIASGELATYDHSKTLLKRLSGADDNFNLHVAASLITGLVATTVAAPFDLIKTR